MRIGIDCRLWDETGVGRYTRNLVLELDKLDERNSYTLFALSKNIANIKNQISKIKSGAWTIVSTDIRWHTVEEQLEFPRVLERENLDLVHFPYFSVPIFYNRPFVVTIHDLIIHHFPTGQASTLPSPLYWLKLQGYKFVIKKAAQKAKKVIAVSQATKREIVDHLGVSVDKVAVTYEGVDEELKSAKNQYTSILASKKFFLYVGNAYPHKNLKRLIEAFTIIRKQHPEITLVLVGRNDFFYQRLKKEAEANEGLVFCSSVSDEELAWFYGHAVALVIPSLMEGFGLTTLEAMANNCPILASDIPSLREICHNAAIFFDPFDPSDIATKMESILSLPAEKRNALLAAGVNHARQFSWEKMAKETLQVYESSPSASSGQAQDKH